ncbi:MAG: hypothetical protein IJ491_08835 [Clostridia bacterium]|nr:hypothetical protein [Clostridia bacterium]
MISLLTKAADEIEVDKKQALRFMGCKQEIISEDFDELYNECLELYLASADLKAVVRKTDVSFQDGNKIKFDFGTIESESLKKNLRGCKSAYVFAATAGSEVDRQIKKLSVMSDGKAMILSCIASSGIECWCDFINDEMARNKVLRPRFSPGYGDVSLCVQKDIFDFLDVNRKLGMSLTEALMMVPVKSVTAIVGIVEENI